MKKWEKKRSYEKTKRKNGTQGAGPKGVLVASSVVMFYSRVAYHLFPLSSWTRKWQSTVLHIWLSSMNIAKRYTFYSVCIWESGDGEVSGNGENLMFQNWKTDLLKQFALFFARFLWCRQYVHWWLRWKVSSLQFCVGVFLAGSPIVLRCSGLSRVHATKLGESENICCALAWWNILLGDWIKPSWIRCPTEIKLCKPDCLKEGTGEEWLQSFQRLFWWFSFSEWLNHSSCSRWWMLCSVSSENIGMTSWFNWWIMGRVPNIVSPCALERLISSRVGRCMYGLHWSPCFSMPLLCRIS